MAQTVSSKRSAKPWTKREITLLKLMVSGAPRIRIAGRTHIAILGKIRELGLKKGRKYLKWTYDELQAIRSGVIVEGRTLSTIQRCKTRLLRLLKRPHRCRWSSNNIDLLIESHKRGLSARDMHSQKILPPSLSITAIQKKLCRLGLVKRNRSGLVYRRFDPVTREAFERFLIQHWKGKLPIELAEMWNDSQRFKVTDKKVSNYLAKLGIKISCYEVYHIKKQREYERQIIDRIGLEAPSILTDQIKAYRVKMMSRRYTHGLDIWTGLKLEIPLYIDIDD